VREAKHVSNQRLIQIAETQDFVRQQLVTNWEALRTAESEIISRKAQVDAAKIAREGVHQEADLGVRTILDTLDADQEYLDAETSLVTAQRDKVVAQFALAASLGMLRPVNLGFEDSSVHLARHLDAVEWKILGMDVDSVENNP
jgi:outer membrane protein TolC